MLRHRFLASAVARLPIVDATQHAWCLTMATDGYTVFVNATFCEELSDGELEFVFAHEHLHCVLGHMDRRGRRGRRLWNVATDLVVNSLLVDAGMSMPSKALYDRDFRGMTSEVAYDSLQARAGRTQGGLDALLSRYEGAARTHPGKSRSTQVAGRWDYHIEPADPEGAGARGGDSPTAAERARIRAGLAKDLQHLPGTAAGQAAAEVTAATAPALAWHQVMARFISGLRRNDYRLFPPNKKHIWRGLYLPALGAPGPEHIIVAVDTSASVDDSLLARVLSEISALRSAAQCQLTILHCDTVIQRVDSFEAHETAAWEPAQGATYAFRGRGGTNLTPPFAWVDEASRTRGVHVDALIFITDGFGPVSCGPPPYPVLWCLPPHGVMPASFGTELRLPGPSED